VFGSARERGIAHGRLLSERLLRFVDVALPAFYVQEVDGLVANTKLPDWLQAKIRPLAEKHAAAAFDLALGWLESVQHAFNNASAAAVFTEIDGIAEGACAAAAQACDSKALAATLRRVNVLPDLIRMQCSMLGAWGSATPIGTLLQLRSLDFGGGPFANNSILLVHHPAPPTAGSLPQFQQFAALSWPGFVGAVTGFNPSLSLSEKVNDIHGGGTPHGTYHGQTTALVLRDVLQFAQAAEQSQVGAKEKAYDIMAAAKRTWGVWLGVGDSQSQQAMVVEYEEASAVGYNATTLPSRTGQPAVADVVYVDKHAQPSPDTIMPDAVKSLAAAGNVTAETVAALGEVTQSGDVHIAIYDFRPSRGCGRRLFTVYFALGSTDSNGTYSGPGGRKAWAAPYVRFEAGALFEERAPDLAALAHGQGA